MYRIAFYFIRQTVPWLLLCLAGLMLAFVTTQLLRVAPVFAGSGASLSESALALGLLLIPVGGWALTPAFAVAVFAATGRMAADGELVALDASGIRRSLLTVGPLSLALALVVLSAWVSLDLGPRSQGALRDIAVRMAARALAGKVEAQVFGEPLDGVTFFADGQSSPGNFTGVFMEDGRDGARSMQFVAEKGSIGVGSSQRMLDIRLKSGAAFISPTSPADPPLAVSFETLALKLPLEDELDRNLDFLPDELAVSTRALLGPPPKGFRAEDWSYALWRRVAGPVGFLSFSLLCIALALGSSLKRRGTAAAFAAALFLGYHLFCRLAESLMQSGLLSGRAAALAPPAVVLAAFVAIAARSLAETKAAGQDS